MERPPSELELISVTDHQYNVYLTTVKGMQTSQVAEAARPVAGCAIIIARVRKSRKSSAWKIRR